MKKSSKKFPKISGIGPFFELDGRRQRAVIAMIEEDLTDEELGKIVDRTARTVRNWKNDDLIIAAKEQYIKITAKRKYVPDAMKRLYYLMINAKSEMVQLQSAITILKMSGMMSDNSTPELDKAKVRKANAEADIAEYKVKVLSEAGASGVELVNKYLDKLDAATNEEVCGNNES